MRGGEVDHVRSEMRCGADGGGATQNAVIAVSIAQRVRIVSEKNEKLISSFKYERR